MLKVSGRFSIMHAIKGGWTCQIFAQAKRNESGGRKSRIRFSKEERKEMVESFIKKYQSLNNGNFPSLNLTHKEVGGSFYTIREIVREIIQKNRVLGPAKSLPEERDADHLFKHYPLGTICTEPEASLSISPDGSPLVCYQHHDTAEELYLVSDKVYAQPGKGQIVNGTHINFTNKVCHDPGAANDQVNESIETNETMKEVSVSRIEVAEMADVTVETYPFRPITQPTDNLDRNSGELRDLKGPLVKKDVEKVSLGPRYDVSLLDGTILSHYASSVDDKEVENVADCLLEGDSKLIDKKAMKTTEDIPSGSSNSFDTKNDVMHHAEDDIDVEVKPSPYDKTTAETKVINTSNVIEIKSMNGTNASAKSTEPTSHEEAIIRNKADIQQSDNSQKWSNPALHRINLETWEGEPKTPKTSETNPVVATFKSIIAAIVKFWSE